MKPKLHFHTDNTFWSGAEQLLTCLFGSEALCEAFDLSFSYRYSKPFYDGMCKWLDVAGVKQYPVSYPLNYSGNRYLKYITCDFTAGKIKKALQVLKPDIFHIHNGGYPGAMGCNAAAIAGKELKIPMVYFVSNMPKQRNLLQKTFEIPMDRYIANYVGVFLSGSQVVADEVNKILKVDKAISIPTTIHPNKLAFSRNRIRSQLGVGMDETLIVSMGVLEKRKGHFYLLKAFRELAQERGTKVNLWIVGSGPELRSLKKHAYGCVTFIADSFDSYSYINACDIYCQPSIEHEDFPVSILQAMKLGKPVVASNVAGIPEQVRHCEDGFVIGPKDEHMLYGCLNALTENKEVRWLFGKNAQQRFEQEFAYEKVMDRYVEFYKGLVV